MYGVIALYALLIVFAATCRPIPWPKSVAQKLIRTFTDFPTLKNFTDFPDFTDLPSLTV